MVLWKGLSNHVLQHPITDPRDRDACAQSGRDEGYEKKASLGFDAETPKNGVGEWGMKKRQELKVLERAVFVCAKSLQTVLKIAYEAMQKFNNGKTPVYTPFL